jgi:membrane protein
MRDAPQPSDSTTGPHPPAGAEGPVARYWYFVRYVVQRLGEDKVVQAAAALTYTTLLALVPLAAVGFAIFSAFPRFESLRGRVEDFIFENFAPHAGDTIREYLTTFLQNTEGLTTVGVVFLVVSAILLLSTIESTFNGIWRTKGRRSMTVRLLAYWAVLTLGPLLFGASLSVSSYMWGQMIAAGGETVRGPAGFFASQLFPFFMEVTGFTVMYMVLPHASVRLVNALVGAVVAAVLFEVLKKLFGIYVGLFAGYKTIYGAMATVPLFLIWMHLSWIVALVGGIITSALPEWRRAVAGARAEPAPDDK